MPAFIDLCLTTWKKLNPDYTIRVLNDTSVWTWLDKKDLPRQYDKLDIAHQSDAIRLALLLRYGGVWIDASTLLVQPVSQIIGTDPSKRYFFTTNHMAPEMQKRERRVSPQFFVENWFLAAPPGDLMLQRTSDCYTNFFWQDAFPIGVHGIRPLGSTGLFSRRQLEEAEALGLNSYFAMYACFFKAVDEDAGLWRWWHGPNVVHFDSWETAFVLYKQGWDYNSWFRPLVSGRKESLSRELLSENSKLIKFPAAQRDLVIGLSMDELLQTNSTLYEVLSRTSFKRELSHLGQEGYIQT
jgi:hypothetical protein